VRHEVEAHSWTQGRPFATCLPAWATWIYTNLQGGWGDRQTFYFHENGNAYKAGGGSWAATSDARLKTVDSDYEHGLDALSGLRPVRYHYKENNPRGEPTDRPFIGLVAQEAMTVMPELVAMRDDGYYDLDPSALTFALINAVKELKAANDNLALTVEEQGREIERLKAAR